MAPRRAVTWSAVTVMLGLASSEALAEPERPAPAPEQAEEPTSRATAAEAERLFREGRAAARTGDARLACTKFAASLQLEHATGTLINLADCHEKLGRWVSALSELHQAAAELPASDDRTAVVAERIAYLENHLPRLTLRTRAPLPGGARVFRDEAEIAEAAFGVAMGVDPGVHRVRLVVMGEPDRVGDVHLAEGERRDLWLEELGGGLAHAPSRPHQGTLAASSENTTPAAATEPSSPLRTAGWISLGVGAAALASGAALGLMTLDAKSTVSRECDASRACTQRGLDALDSGPVYSTLSTVSFITAAAAGAIGVYLLLAHPRATATKATSLLATSAQAWGLSLGGALE